ncbi:tetratricopeptide repeat protein [Thermaerobacillus caldiproteolyticus]|uniref:Tetratricopeptide (TPR) repeat protein n=1 Tax=Thermaerobacillus caldiproteolyticus TaxID=247480 RepID=A0A7W0BZ71_9BACL|nr:tetratricopeptide repeat protein [Anoxybacillus caldiproteolyticus]MBA2875738.1 tetratricopeptide (TPR) repeat protein [Anoxybacillus caldiproteolyticus]QPA30637.1 tetratricopeptide repeat protein [Anoxybacillus caldiproteolyticus]
MGKQLKPNRSTAKIIPFVQSGEYYFEKGINAYRRRDLYKAKKYLERAVQLNAREAMFVSQLAVVLAELGEYQASNQLFFKVIHELDREMNECFYFLANNYAHLGLFREAMKYAETYLERDPNGDFADETEDLIELLSIENEDYDEIGNQDDLIVKQEKARTLLEKGDFRDAINVLESIIADYPEFWSAYNNLALAHFYMGNAKRAQEIIHEVLERNPGNLHALCNRLVFYYYLRDDKQVDRLVQQLARVHPFLVEHRYKLGATFALVGRFDLAFKWLRHLYKIRFDGDYSFYYWLSYAAYYTGHDQLAKTAWEKVINLSPDKQGQEPWNDSPLFIQKEIEKITQWLNGTKTEEILYGLYLMSKSLYKNELVAYSNVKRHMANHPLIKQFADYVLFETNPLIPVYIADSHLVINRLWEKNHFDDEKMYITWFYIFVKALETTEHFSNHSAWAAATEYVWRQQQGQYITQKFIAEKYNVSLSTVKKYVKKVKELLS